jgi:hypothetical protein
VSFSFVELRLKKSHKVPIRCGLTRPHRAPVGPAADVQNRRILTIHSTGVNRFLTNCHRRFTHLRQWYPGPTRLTYTLNWNNKLRKAEWPGNNSIELKYDPLGNRVYKKSTASGSATERKYVVDITGELPVILMQIEPASGNIMKTYIYRNSEVLAQHGAMKLAIMRQEAG